MGKLPAVPYREPEPWVPSGGFGQLRTPEEQARDAELAAQHAVDGEGVDLVDQAEEEDEEDPVDEAEEPHSGS